ncbi:MAG: SCP2 sterol-binding domain-containing protein [Deltaproteobacteria bacterium]|nr:SCP2 sterol-binding domain-containing protein [Deltaproteobacteria bacterium]
MAFSNVADIFEGMPKAFNAAAAGNADLTFQFDLSGPQGGTWNVVVKDGACQVNQGAAEKPTVTIAMADTDYLDMINGKLNGVTAFMTGKLKATGDIMAAQKLSSFFKLA